MTTRLSLITSRAIVVTVFAVAVAAMAGWAIAGTYIPGIGLLLGLFLWLSWGWAKRRDQKQAAGTLSQ